MTKDNFNTYSHKAHDAYATTLGNMLKSRPALVRLINQIKLENSKTESDEDPEEELEEPPAPHIPAGKTSHDLNVDQIQETQHADQRDDDHYPRQLGINVDSLLRKPTDVVLINDMRVEPGDYPIQKTKLYDLEKAYNELQ